MYNALMCAGCGRVVDAKGVEDTGRYCKDACRYPNGGCGERIYYMVDESDGRRRAYDLLTGRPHKDSCRARMESDETGKVCPRCGGVKPKNSGCRHCGFDPATPLTPGRFSIPTLMSFGSK